MSINLTIMMIDAIGIKWTKQNGREINVDFILIPSSRMKKRILNQYIQLIVALLSAQISSAQPSKTDSSASAQNYWFTGQYTFVNSCVGNTISSRGLTLNLGFNLAKIFSDKIILGVTADLKVLPGLWKPKTSSTFLNDFNHSLISPQNDFDSINMSIVSQNYNQGGLVGNNKYYIGGMLSLFPQKYGGLLFEAKYGNTYFQARNNVFNNPNIAQHGFNRNSISTSGNWIISLTIKPMSFFKNTYIDRKKMVGQDFLKSLSVGFFYERFRYGSAQFNGTQLSDFMNDDFNHRFSMDNRFGFKIGFSFY